MAIDFPLAPLHRYLWDHLGEIITPSSRRLGVSNAWASGVGFEGFDDFRVELKKFPGGQSNPTFLLLVCLSPPLPVRQKSRGDPRATPAAAAAADARAAAATEMVTEHRFVLRKKPASVKVSSAHAVEREFRVLRALRETDVPVPQALLLCEDPGVIGTPFYVMEFVNGRVFSDSALPGMGRRERAAAYASAAETLAKIHRLDFVSVGLEGFGRSSGGYLGRQVATLERVAKKQEEDAEPIPGFGEVVKDLLELSPGVPDRVTLVHGDFRVDNLVFHPTEPRVIAVLDWELSTLGHPLADLANLCILHHLPAAPAEAPGGASKGRVKSSPLAGLKGLDLRALGIPEQSELMDVYREAVGRDRLAGVAGRGVAELGLAFIFFKMAVIAHGVKARLSRGVASSESASIVSAMVPVMVDLAKGQISALRRTRAHDADDDGGDRGGESDSGGGGGNDRHKSKPQRPRPKAVLFDVGGVLSTSPLLAISRFERETRLPPSYIGVAIAAGGEDGLFQRLERGEERLGDRFLGRFAEYLCGDHAKLAYVEYVARRARGRSLSTLVVSAAADIAEIGSVEPSAEGSVGAAAAAAVAKAKTAVAAVVSIDVLELFRAITAAAAVPVPEMIAAAKTLRHRGLKVAVVSNDFLLEKGFVLGGQRRSRAGTERDSDSLRHAAAGARQASGGVYSQLPALCDAVVLSSVVGRRKPDRRIYEDACESLGVSPREAVFVDDIRANVRAAEACGMQAVWVRPGGSVEGRRAIVELQAITGVALTTGDGYTRGDDVRFPVGKL